MFRNMVQLANPHNNKTKNSSGVSYSVNLHQYLVRIILVWIIVGVISGRIIPRGVVSTTVSGGICARSAVRAWIHGLHQWTELTDK